MLAGERQVAPTVDGIRRDHTARYEWVAARLAPDSSVIDAGCGVGYGSAILAGVCAEVFAFDNDHDALRYAEANYSRPNITYGSDNAEVASFAAGSVFSAAVAFEIVEHLADPRPLLKALSECAPILYASAPNEKVFPFKNYKFHHRHYTTEQFEALLNECGWKVDEWWGQAGPESYLERDLEGRTLVVKASARRIDEASALPKSDADPRLVRLMTPTPKHVAIVGLGFSAEAYMDRVKRCGSRRAFADQVWGINAVGDVLSCDLVWHMDDVRIQVIRAAARPESNIAAMLPWLKSTTLPVVTSRAHPDYPALVEFPLEAVMSEFGLGYFNNTPAYAVAYAIYIGVKRISLFGLDFTYPSAHKSEKGRGCLEFWLGYATARGIEIAIPENSSLMDHIDDPKDDNEAIFYGYDTVKLIYKRSEDGKFTIDMIPREKLPSAEEIEAAYDHGKHPALQGKIRK